MWGNLYDTQVGAVTVYVSEMSTLPHSEIVSEVYSRLLFECVDDLPRYFVLPSMSDRRRGRPSEAGS